MLFNKTISKDLIAYNNQYQDYKDQKCQKGATLVRPDSLNRVKNMKEEDPINI